MAGMKLAGGIAAVALGALLALPSAALAAEPAAAKNVTFSKDVAPIFQAKCQSCHEPGSIAPMSLITYQESRPCWTTAIVKVTVKGTATPKTTGGGQ